MIEGPPVVPRYRALILVKGIRLLPPGPRNEIPDAVPGAEPRVQMLVGLEDDVHPVLTEGRLEFGP